MSEIKTKKILWKKNLRFVVRENIWWALYRLRVLALPKQCDDDVASVVGLNCPKLECIILTGTAVTNVGLSWLLCCRQLHTLIMPGFFQGVTPKGNSHKGSFNNYVDIVLSFFDHLKPNYFKKQSSSSSFLIARLARSNPRNSFLACWPFAFSLCHLLKFWSISSCFDFKSWHV